ncbi:hypothetical protein [Amaricoccus macauensis]|uniref:hypothetical protein n=1 Tax=Amaricoccus macauensis TaxID=57001 RepID=UPI003C7A450B
MKPFRAAMQTQGCESVPDCFIARSTPLRKPTHSPAFYRHSRNMGAYLHRCGEQFAPVRVQPFAANAAAAAASQTNSAVSGS